MYLFPSKIFAAKSGVVSESESMNIHLNNHVSIKFASPSFKQVLYLLTYSCEVDLTATMELSWLPIISSTIVRRRSPMVTVYSAKQRNHPRIQHFSKGSDLKARYVNKPTQTSRSIIENPKPISHEELPALDHRKWGSQGNEIPTGKTVRENSVLNCIWTDIRRHT